VDREIKIKGARNGPSCLLRCASKNLGKSAIAEYIEELLQSTRVKRCTSAVQAGCRFEYLSECSRIPSGRSGKRLSIINADDRGLFDCYVRY
jgi:hypothetical protein